MVTIGITGAEGLLGWHTRCFLDARSDVAIKVANRASFLSEDLLEQFVTGCDAIIHYAGVNRGTDAEIEETNPRLAKLLVSACDQREVAPHVIFSSSMHDRTDTTYGKSKRATDDLLNRWASRSGAKYTTLVLPHVFGEFGRPFYNSVLATFCHQLAVGDNPKIISDTDLVLIHAQDVAQIALTTIDEKTTGRITVDGHLTTVSDLLAELQYLFDLYRNTIVPSLSDKHTLRLFNTLRASMFPAFYPVDLHLHTDSRGSLFEAVKGYSGGQTFISTTKPGIVRGNHFHFAKHERFLVISGSAEINIRKLFSTDLYTFKVSGIKPQYIDIPTMCTHNIKNIGQAELTTLFWANEIFDPRQPDTHALVV